MAYQRGVIPPGIDKNKLALDAAEGWAEYLESLGAEVEWVRGMSTYSLPNDWYIARGDVSVICPDGTKVQFGADSVSLTADFLNAVFPDPEDFGHLYREKLWENAVRAALEPALGLAFPRYHVRLDSSFEVALLYRDGEWLDHSKTPRRLRGFIAGFLAAWEVTAPRPDKEDHSAEPAGTSPDQAP